MAYEQKMYNESIKTLLLAVIGLPLISPTNIDCGGQAFHCVNATHFMICVDVGGGRSSTVDRQLIACPPPTACRPRNRFECELPLAPAPTPAERLLVNPIANTRLDEHMELTTPGPLTDYTVVYTPLQSVLVNETTAIVSEKDTAQFQPTADPLNITTFVAKPSASDNVSENFTISENITPTSAILLNQTYDNVTDSMSVPIKTSLTDTLDVLNQNNSEGVSNNNKTEHNSLTGETTATFETVTTKTATESIKSNETLANFNTVNALLGNNYTNRNNSDSPFGGTIPKTTEKNVFVEEKVRFNSTLDQFDSAVDTDDIINVSSKTNNIGDRKFILERAVNLENVINVTEPKPAVTGSTEIDATLSIVGTELYPNINITNTAGMTNFVGVPKNYDSMAEVAQSGLAFTVESYVTTESTEISAGSTEPLTTYDTTTEATATTKATTILVKLPTIMDPAAITTVENIKFQTTAGSTAPVVDTLNVYHQQLDETVAKPTSTREKGFVPVENLSRSDTRKGGKLENFLEKTFNNSQNASKKLPLQKQLSERAITSSLELSTDPATQGLNIKISNVHDTSSDILQNHIITTVKTKSDADFNAYQTENQEANIAFTDTIVKLTTENNSITSGIMDTDKGSNFNTVENEYLEKQIKDLASSFVNTQTTEAILKSGHTFSNKTEIFNTTNTHAQITTKNATKMREDNIAENITLIYNIHNTKSHEAVLDSHISDNPNVIFEITTENITTVPVTSRPIEQPTTDADIMEVTSAKTDIKTDSYTQEGQTSFYIFTEKEADATPATLTLTVEDSILNQTVISIKSIPYTNHPSVENAQNKPSNVETDQETLYKLKSINFPLETDSKDFKGTLDLSKQDTNNDSLPNIKKDTSKTNKSINTIPIKILHSSDLTTELRLSEVDPEYVNKTTKNESSDYSMNTEETVQSIINQHVNIGLRANVTNRFTETEKSTTENNTYETKPHSLNKNITTESFEETASLSESPFQEGTDDNIAVTQINTLNLTLHSNYTMVKFENITVENKTLIPFNSTNANISKEYPPPVSERKYINEMESLPVTQSKGVVKSVVNKTEKHISTPSASKTHSTKDHSLVTRVVNWPSGVENEYKKTIIENPLLNSKTVHNPVENVLFNGSNNLDEASTMPALTEKNTQSSKIVAEVTIGVVNIFDDHSSGTTDSAATSYFAPELPKWPKRLETDALEPYENSNVSGISQTTNNNINTTYLTQINAAQDTSSTSTTLRNEKECLDSDKDANKQTMNNTSTELFNSTNSAIGSELPALNFNTTRDPKYVETTENLEFVSNNFNRSGVIMKLPLESSSVDMTPGISLSQSTLEDIIKETLAEDENTDVILETFISVNVTATPSIYERESNDSLKMIIPSSRPNQNTKPRISTNSAQHKKFDAQILMEPKYLTETTLLLNVLSPTERSSIILDHSTDTLYSPSHANSGRDPDITFHGQSALEHNADSLHNVQQKSSESPSNKSSAANVTIFDVNVSKTTLITAIDSTLPNPDTISEPNAVTEAITLKITTETAILTSSSTEVSASSSASSAPPRTTSSPTGIGTATAATATKYATLSNTITETATSDTTATFSTLASGMAAPDCTLCTATTTSATVTSGADTLDSSAPETNATGTLISDNVTADTTMSGNTISSSLTATAATDTVLRGYSTPGSTAAYDTVISGSALSSPLVNIFVLTDSAVPGTALKNSTSDFIASVSTTTRTATIGAAISENSTSKVITVTDTEKSDNATSAIGSASIGIYSTASYDTFATGRSTTVMSSPGIFTLETLGSTNKDITTSRTGKLGNNTKTTASGGTSHDTASGRATTDTTISITTAPGIAVTLGSYVSGSTAYSAATGIAASDTASSDDSTLSSATLDSSFQENSPEGTTASLIITKDTAVLGFAKLASTSGTASSGVSALSRDSETITGSTRDSDLRATVTDTATSVTAILGTFLSSFSTLSSFPGGATIGKGTIRATTDSETINTNTPGVEISAPGLSGTSSGSVAIATAATDTITVGIHTSYNSESNTTPDNKEYTPGTATSEKSPTSTGASSSSISYGITGSALTPLAETTAPGTSVSGIVLSDSSLNTIGSSNATKSPTSETSTSGTAISDKTIPGTSLSGSTPVIHSSSSTTSSTARGTTTTGMTKSVGISSQYAKAGIVLPETAIIATAALETESLDNVSAGTFTSGITIRSSTIDTDATDTASLGRTRIISTSETATLGTTIPETSILGTSTSTTAGISSASSFSAPLSRRTPDFISVKNAKTKRTSTLGTAAVTIGKKTTTSTVIVTSTGIVVNKKTASLTDTTIKDTATSPNTAISPGTAVKGANIPEIASIKSSTIDAVSNSSVKSPRSTTLSHASTGAVTTGTATTPIVIVTKGTSTQRTVTIGTAASTKTAKTSTATVGAASTEHSTTGTSASSTTSTDTSTPGAAPAGGPSGWSCSGRPRGRYADEEDCRRFYLCVGASRALAGLCPNNTVFSDLRKQCTRNLSHCVRRNQFKCVSAGRFTDLIQPNVYYICMKRGEVFYRYKLQCQKGYYLDKNVHCVTIPEPTAAGSLSGSAGDSSQPPGPRPRPAATALECDGEGKFADPYDCRGYYVCKSTDSSGDTYHRKHKTCDEDEVFDRKKKKCVDASDNECRYCDRVITGVYYVETRKQGYLVKFKLQCRSGYSLDRSTVKCSRAPSCGLEPCASVGAERGRVRGWGRCGAEGRSPDPRDPRRYYECRGRRGRYQQRHRKCGKHKVFSPHRRKCVRGGSGAGDGGSDL